MPGPRALPANVHQLRGNASHLPKAALLDDVVRPPVEIPKRPTWLKGEARKEWDLITVHLEALGLISQIDHATLEAYCKVYARWVHVEKQIDKLQADFDDDRGLVYKKSSGMQSITALQKLSLDLLDKIRQLAAEFGMTPAARGRVTASDPQLGLPGVDPAPSEGGWASFK